MPESQHKYLYERLGAQDFQQLVSALLTNNFSDYVPMALGQADGGRDGLRKDEAGRALVYQVKWSGDVKRKDPVSWLDQVVRSEADNLRRLAAEGVRRYVLVTNIASTGKAGTGTFDRLQAKLDGYAKDFGYEDVSCIWREGLDAFVDNAPLETKWTYADMLAGWDLVRYLVAEHVGGAKDNQLRDLVRKVTAAQWAEDQQVKFSQSDVDRESVVDLFVDVTAERIHSPVPTLGRARVSASLGGAANYLLGSTTPFTLVRGAPGQGKSTLSQYICQAHRTSFLPEVQRPTALPVMDKPLFPIRLDLSDYALWLTGNDAWDNSDPRKRPRAKARSGHLAALEQFLADLLTYESGKASVTADDVQDIFRRLPSLIVLDGLDEVGSTAARGRVVAEIDKFVARGKAYPVPPRVVVTTRPSAGMLPEPSADRFEIIALNQLTTDQRDIYLRKWCAVREITGKEGRALRNGFKEKSREPYIAELAGNPMQLTILLDLLHRQGAATPAQRTDLYDKYVDLLLAREANKRPRVVKDHQEELREIIPFLGWYLHAHSEQSQISGRMNIAELKAAMLHFQRSHGNRETVVDKLFEGASDRLWALTSKVDGTYEFEVLSLREYFAARFLYFNAGEDDPDFDIAYVVRELLRRPYWLNTARFYGGNARGRAIPALTVAIEDELAQGTSASSFVAAWTLLTDGVFQRRPREARKVLTALCSDRGLAVLLPAIDRGDIIPLPQLPVLPTDEGLDPTWTRLTALIARDPADPAHIKRVRTLRDLLGQRAEFNSWWYENLRKAVGTPQQKTWLTLGATCEAGAGITFDVPELPDDSAESFLGTGLVPPAGSALETKLLDAVLDGQCLDVKPVRSMPAQVAVALSPHRFFTGYDDGFAVPDEDFANRRTLAINHLRKAKSPYASIAMMRSFRAGEKGSTFPWARTAAALYDQAGRCWLASQIAIIGAASPFHLGHTKRLGATAFGPDSHPSELLGQTRAHGADVDWWGHQLDRCQNEFEQAEWALALWSVASGDAVTELLPTLERVVDGLSPARHRAVQRAAMQITRFGWTDQRPCSGAATADWLKTLIEIRSGNGSPQASKSEGSLVQQVERTPTDSLLSIARTQHWLKVDATPAYR